MKARAKEQGHWAKFTDAARDIETFGKACLPEYRGHYALLSELLSTAQRFYLPDGANVLEGKLFDEQLKELFRLPYDAIAVLSESSWSDRDEATWKISIAIDPRSRSADRVTQGELAAFPGQSFLLASISKGPIDLSGAWRSVPFFAGAIMLEGQPGITIRLPRHAQPFVTEAERVGVEYTREFLPDLTSITNLCALLNLHGSRADRVDVPTALQRKRRLLRRRELYDYHVLNVGGERWDSPYVASGSGSGEGVRSHLRRGHIRQLSTGRNVWVRATYVHGSVPGFVDKDYKVDPT